MELGFNVVIAWMAGGLAAGWVVSSVMKRSDQAHRLSGDVFVGNIVVGIIGAIVSGLLFSALVPSGSAGLVGRIIDGLGGAAVLLACVRVLANATPSDRRIALRY